jgi:glutamate 5-kinase
MTDETFLVQKVDSSSLVHATSKQVSLISFNFENKELKRIEKKEFNAIEQVICVKQEYALVRDGG